MIGRANRFHGYGSLRPVYRHGQTARSPLLGLRYGLNKHRQQWRLAVVVSKKINKSAVGRNRLRRQLYETVRQLAPAIDQPYDLVLTVYQADLADVAPAALQKQVTDLFAKAGIIGRGMIDGKEK